MARNTQTSYLFQIAQGIATRNNVAFGKREQNRVATFLLGTFSPRAIRAAEKDITRAETYGGFVAMAAKYNRSKNIFERSLSECIEPSTIDFLVEMRHAIVG